MPAVAWNTISGFIQLRLVKGDKVKREKDTFEIASRVEPYAMVPLFDADKRCLLYSSSRRTSDDTTLLDPSIVNTIEGAEIPIIWAKHTD